MSKLTERDCDWITAKLHAMVDEWRKQVLPIQEWAEDAALPVFKVTIRLPYTTEHITLVVGVEDGEPRS